MYSTQFCWPSLCLPKPTLLLAAPQGGAPSTGAAPGQPANSCLLWDLLNHCSTHLAGAAGAARALWQRIEQELGWSWQHLVSLSGWPFVATLYRTFRRDIPATFSSRETLLRSLRQVLWHAIRARLSQLASGKAPLSSLLQGHALGLQLALKPAAHAAESLLVGSMLMWGYALSANHPLASQD